MTTTHVNSDIEMEKKHNNEEDNNNNEMIESMTIIPLSSSNVDDSNSDNTYLCNNDNVIISSSVLEAGSDDMRDNFDVFDVCNNHEEKMNINKNEIQESVMIFEDCVNITDNDVCTNIFDVFDDFVVFEGCDDNVSNVGNSTTMEPTNDQSYEVQQSYLIANSDQPMGSRLQQQSSEQQDMESDQMLQPTSDQRPTELTTNGQPTEEQQLMELTREQYNIETISNSSSGECDVDMDTPKQRRNRKRKCAAKKKKTTKGTMKMLVRMRVPVKIVIVTATEVMRIT